MTCIIAVIVSIIAVGVFISCVEGRIAMKELDCQYWCCDCCKDYNETDLEVCYKCGNKRC